MTGIRREFVKSRPKILCAPTHERYQSYMSDLDFDFYMINLKGWKKWERTYASPPKNHREINSLTPDLTPDLVFAQQKSGQFQLFSEISASLKIPLVSLTHILPPQNMDEKIRYSFLSMQGQENVFLSSLSRDLWGFPEESSTVIKQCVDSDFWRPISCKKKNLILSVVNEFDKRDDACNYSGWLKSTKGLPTKIIGSSSTGISTPAASLEDLRASYNSAKVFFNSSTNSTFPFSLFEAMSCGACVVSSATSMIPDVIKNGQNGFLYDVNNPNEGRDLLAHILSLPDDTVEAIGKNARKTIEENFSKKEFTESWTNLFNKALNENPYNTRSA